MDPPEHHQILAINILEQLLFVLHIASIARDLLLRNHQSSDKQRILYQRAAEHPARLEVAPGIRVCDFQEFVAEVRGEEDCAETLAVLEACRGFKFVV